MADGLKKAGIPTDEATKRATDIIYAMYDIAGNTDFALANGEKKETDSYNIYSSSELSEMLENLSIDDLIYISGYSGETPDKIVVYDPKQLKALDSLLDDEHVQVWKDIAVNSVLNTYNDWLPDKYNFAPHTSTGDRMAKSMIKSKMENILGEIYAERCYNEDKRETITKICEDLKAEYYILISFKLRDLLIIVGSALMIQFIVRKLTLLLAGVFGRKNMPVAELAATETGSKKPNSGNAVLTVASVSAAAAIFVILSSVLGAFGNPIYDSDLIVSDAYLKTSKYEYVEEAKGVSAVDYIYTGSDKIKFVNDEKAYQMNILSLPTTDQYKALGAIPSELGKNEILADTPAAKKLNIKEGDSLEIIFHSDGIFPVKERLTVRMITAETQFGSTGTIVLSNELYRTLFPDKVSMILIKAAAPEALKSVLEPTFTGGEEVMTMTEYISKTKENNAKIIAITAAIIAASVVLTLIGISGNQLIGFTARKKEYAMLHSCACSWSKIIRLILTENALLFGISCIAAGIVCIQEQA
ncbi:MAG: hypothetical protein K6B74_04485 [Ruminococcus sp.]|nr:hypothetical protein [Ruminococcus sp.]